MFEELTDFEKGFLLAMILKDRESAKTDYGRFQLLTSIYEKLKKAYVAEGAMEKES